MCADVHQPSSQPRCKRDVENNVKKVFRHEEGEGKVTPLQALEYALLGALCMECKLFLPMLCYAAKMCKNKHYLCGFSCIECCAQGLCVAPPMTRECYRDLSREIGANRMAMMEWSFTAGDPQTVELRWQPISSAWLADESHYLPERKI